MKIIIPTECPCCGSKLGNVNGQLFCRNKSGCSAQSTKVVENFCKKMKIKGFGAKTLEKLELTSIWNLYDLSLPELVDTLGEKIGTKLFNEIEKSKTPEFAAFIGSLGINLIGTVAGNKLATKCNSLNDISESVCKAAGLGDKATESLMSWLSSPQGEDIQDTVNCYIHFAEVSAKPIQVSAKPMIEICITGKLNDYKSRKEAEAFLAQFNITVKKTVTKSVQFLVCEDDSKKGSSSYKKAQANGLPITNIKNLISSLENTL